jgi:PhzF family phenazine biosynthesis protein
MKLTFYQVDAFTSKLFGGNPAAVIPLDNWLDDATMQNIALENNLSETAFIVKENKNYHIRWMTPTVEVPLCGHATLASSFVLFNFLEPGLEKIIFNSKSGELIVTRNDDMISLDFPANKPEPVEFNRKLIDAIPDEPKELLRNDAHVAVYEDEKTVRQISPDLRVVLTEAPGGLIVTAPGDNVDFVSRYFVPSSGIDEDPVTGYAHTVLTPYWSEKLGKDKLHANQVSKRGGDLYVEDLKGRVKISGKAVLYMKGEIEI